jgi:hypothetical protein
MFAFQVSNGTTPTCAAWPSSAVLHPTSFAWIDVWDITTGHSIGEPGQSTTGLPTSGVAAASAEVGSYYVQATHGGNTYIVFSVPSTTDTYDIWGEISAGGLVLEAAGDPAGVFTDTAITNVSGTGLSMSPLQDLGAGTDSDYYDQIGLYEGFTCNP